MKKKPKPPPRHAPFIPTSEQTKMVEQMASFGIHQENIAACVDNPATGKPITAKTLRRAFRRVLTIGKTKMITNVATSLYNRAISPRSPQGATAGIFILKTQAGAVGASWVDKIRVDIPGLNDNFAERLAKALTAKAHAKAQR